MTTGLIKEQIAFAKRARPSKRLDFSWRNILREKVNEEDFVHWCQKEEPRELVGELESEEPSRLSIRLLIRSIIP